MPSSMSSRPASASECGLTMRGRDLVREGAKETSGGGREEEARQRQRPVGVRYQHRGVVFGRQPQPQPQHVANEEEEEREAEGSRERSRVLALLPALSVEQVPPHPLCLPHSSHIHQPTPFPRTYTNQPPSLKHHKKPYMSCACATSEGAPPPPCMSVLSSAPYPRPLASPLTPPLLPSCLSPSPSLPLVGVCMHVLGQMQGLSHSQLVHRLMQEQVSSDRPASLAHLLIRPLLQPTRLTCTPLRPLLQPTRLTCTPLRPLLQTFTALWC
jgi:hypothetical protein